MNRSSSCGHFQAGLCSILRGRPQAAANISGSRNYPGISGVVRLYQTGEGVIVFAQIHGLPLPDHPCRERIFGFHIHEGPDLGTPWPTTIRAAVNTRTTPGTCRRCSAAAGTRSAWF